MTSFSGAAFAFNERQRAILELERLRRQGVVAAQQVLVLVTPDNIDELWPYIALMLNYLLKAQQEAARDNTMAWMGALAVGVGLGAPPTLFRIPDASLARNGRLPSGMPWQRLTQSGALAVAHRVSNGMTAPEAVQYLKGQMVAAVANQAHDEARKVATDILKAQQRDEGWTALDDEFDRKVTDVRRQRRNLSSKQKFGLGWFDGDERPLRPPGIVRYARVPSPGACSFCLLLATRGAVYYEDSWDRSTKFRKNGEPKAHAHCRCRVLPEPAPGAWKDVIFGDPADYARAVWRDVKYKRQYELSKLTNSKTLLTSGDAWRLQYELAA